MLKIKFFILSLFLFVITPLDCIAKRVVLYKDRPILFDRNIVVETFYDDENFNGYHTDVYSETNPSDLIYHCVNHHSIQIQHQFAVCHITSVYLEKMVAENQARRIAQMQNQQRVVTHAPTPKRLCVKFSLPEILEETYVDQDFDFEQDQQHEEAKDE
jgi:hypothetical protein